MLVEAVAPADRQPNIALLAGLPHANRRYPDAAVRLQDPEQLVAAAWQVNGSRAELALELSKPTFVRPGCERLSMLAANFPAGSSTGACAERPQPPRPASLLELSRYQPQARTRIACLQCCCSRRSACSFTLAAGLCSPVAAGWELARRTRCSVRSRRCRRRVGGCSTRCPGGDGRHRLRRDRSHRHRGRDRDEDQDLRRTPSRARAGASGVAFPTPAPVVPPWRGGGSVSRPRSRSAAPRARCPCRLDRSPDGSAANRRGQASTPRVLVGVPVTTARERSPSDRRRWPLRRRLPLRAVDRAVERRPTRASAGRVSVRPQRGARAASCQSAASTRLRNCRRKSADRRRTVALRVASLAKRATPGEQRGGEEVPRRGSALPLVALSRTGCSRRSRVLVCTRSSCLAVSA